MNFSGARDRLQNNHNHEFSDTLINQLFQEQQPSNFQRNTIPPLAIIFSINWSVGYWWWRSWDWKKSTFQLFPSIIKKVLVLIRRQHRHPISNATLSNFQCNTIPPLAIIFAINWSVGYWWRRSGYWKKSTFQLFPSIIKKVLISADLSATSSPSNFQRSAIQFPMQHYPPTRHKFCN